MKNTLILAFFLMSMSVFSQTSDPSIMSYRRLMNKKNGVVNSKVDGSPLAFEIKNRPIIVTDILNKQHVIPKGNYNAYTDNVVSVTSKDSLSVISKNKIKNFEYNNITYKKFINEDGQNRFYAELYKDNELVFLKGYFVVVTPGTTDPLTQAKSSNDKFNLTEKYYILNVNGRVERFVLKKKNVLRLLADFKSDVSTFVKESNLSYKSESDIIKIFDYYKTLN